MYWKVFRFHILILLPKLTHYFGIRGVLKLAIVSALLGQLNFDQTAAELVKVIFAWYFISVLHYLCSYWLLPALVLKRMVIGNFERGSHDSEMSDAIDFVVDCVSECSCL